MNCLGAQAGFRRSNGSAIIRSVGPWTRWRALILLCAIAVTSLVACGNSAVTEPASSIGTRVDIAVPKAVLDAPLTDAQGKATNLAAFGGKVLVLADAMTLCQEVCPLLGANLVQMARDTSKAGQAGGVALVQLTVDPERDTPARLSAYRRQFDPPPANWTVLTGPASSIKLIWKFFGIAYTRVPEESPAALDWWTGKKLTYDVQHSDIVLFLDKGQHERFIIDATPNTAGQAPPPRLRSFLSAQGRQNLASPEPGSSWTVADGLRVVSWLTGKNVQP